MQAIRHLKVVGPASEKRTVRSPRRLANAEYRNREHLTEAEVERLIAATKDNRQGARDGAMILLAFRHGLRASELSTCVGSKLTSRRRVLHVPVVKRGTPATHPLTGRELRALRRLQREAGPRRSCLSASAAHRSPSGVPDDRRRAPARPPASTFSFTRTCCAMPAVTSSRMKASIPVDAGLSRSQVIQHTVRYTELAPTRFKGLWRD